MGGDTNIVVFETTQLASVSAGSVEHGKMLESNRKEWDESHIEVSNFSVGFIKSWALQLLLAFVV